MQDNYQSLDPQASNLNEQMYLQQKVADPQYYQQKVADPQYYQQKIADQTREYVPASVPAQVETYSSNWFNFSNPSYLKGFLVSAGITLVATNPSVQQSLIKGGLKLWNFLQGGVEEIKEQIQDVKAEMSQK